ncbi:uncharacterized protein LOC144101549 [Amblyomma americanum]
MVPVDQLNLSKPCKKAQRLAAEVSHTSKTYDRRYIEIFDESMGASEVKELSFFLDPNTEGRHKVQGLLDGVLQWRPPLNIEAARWGADKEKVAKEQYFKVMKARHLNFELHEIGFVIDPDLRNIFSKAPFLGATPDGLWLCSCQGVGLLEANCPWLLKEPHRQALEASYLSASGTLLENHTYFTQVQRQLHICRKTVCHFVVWLPLQFATVEVQCSSIIFQPVLEKASVVWAEHVLPALF